MSFLPDINEGKPEITHEVYVRSFNSIKIYKESEIERYMVRHKELSDEEKEYQFNAINGLWPQNNLHTGSKDL